MKSHLASARQRGAAVIIAMGVAAMAAMAATAILVSQSTWSRRHELATQHAQSRALIQAGVDWSRAVLKDDRGSSNVDHLGEPWALRLAPMPVENGRLAGHLEDQQGLFNLNNLVKDGKVVPAEAARYRRLLAILGLPAELTATLIDWVDTDSEPQAQGGAEDQSYLNLQPPYLSANRPLTDTAELALVRGYDEGVRARLRPFVTALPRATPVNVNTAPPEVLAAIIDGLDLDQARAMVAKRERAYFRDAAEFTRQLPADLKGSAEGIAVASQYFMVIVQVNLGSSETRGAALLAREDGGWPTIVWRKYP